MQDGTHRRAVVLDQHPLFLEAVERTLTRSGVAVVGATTSPAEALELVADAQPELLLVGLETVDGATDGLTCVQEASRRAPEMKIVALSVENEPQKVEAAFAAGASAYVVKTAHPDDLSSAIRQAFDNSVFFRSSQPARQFAAAHAAAESPLTRREREILQLVAEGYSNAALARMLWVTEQTVKFHLSNIYRKLDVANRTEASRWAQRHGLLAETPVDEREPDGGRVVSIPSAAVLAGTR